MRIPLDFGSEELGVFFFGFEESQIFRGYVHRFLPGNQIAAFEARGGMKKLLS